MRGGNYLLLMTAAPRTADGGEFQGRGDVVAEERERVMAERRWVDLLFFRFFVRIVTMRKSRSGRKPSSGLVAASRKEIGIVQWLEA